MTALLALLSIAECAALPWIKPEASKSDFVKDQSSCMKELQEPPPSGVTDQQVYQTCMNAHGWKLRHGARLSVVVYLDWLCNKISETAARRWTWTRLREFSRWRSPGEHLSRAALQVRLVLQPYLASSPR